MLNLLQWFFEQIDFVRVAEFIRGRNNRLAAARLLKAVVIAYDIIEIYEILLDELGAASESYGHPSTSQSFELNQYRVSALLLTQMDNLDQLETIVTELYDELRLLDAGFEKTYRHLCRGKFPILWDAHVLLAESRLPLEMPTPDEDWRTAGLRALSFDHSTDEADRVPAWDFVYGTGSTEGVDVHVNDAREFFQELDRYFRESEPYAQLGELRQSADRFKEALLQHLEISDLLTDLGNLRSRPNWAKYR